MDLGTLVIAAYNQIKSIIRSEVGKVMAADLTKATKGSALEIWEKVKPLFIVEEKEVEALKDLKENPTDKDYEDAFLATLRAKLKKNEVLQREIQAILEKAEQTGATGSISGSKNANTGNISDVSGSVVFGDNNKIGK